MRTTTSSLAINRDGPPIDAFTGIGTRLRSRAKYCLATPAFAVAAALLPVKADAADGCLVLLCLAAPNWRAIAQCVPPVQSVLRDLARGRPFPSCNMSGTSGTAANHWSAAPDFCPPQYTTSFDGPSGTVFQCRYDAAVTVSIGGALWTRTWWNMAGETVTEYLPPAKASLGSWDTKFDDDYAAWMSVQSPVTPDCATC
jgi:hypothetical protein